MRTWTSKIIGIVTLLLVFACTTYTIPTKSFREQMIKAKTGNTKDVEITNPLTNGTIKYSSNNIKRLTVVDQEGHTAYLNNSASLEMRVTLRNGKKHILYFDTVILENDTLKGSRSRLVQGLTRKIPMDSIVKIEIQDGGKKYNYKN